jgi:hypothetical protein
LHDEVGSLSSDIVVKQLISEDLFSTVVSKILIFLLKISWIHSWVHQIPACYPCFAPEEVPVLLFFSLEFREISFLCHWKSGWQLILMYSLRAVIQEIINCRKQQERKERID